MPQTYEIEEILLPEPESEKQRLLPPADDTLIIKLPTPAFPQPKHLPRLPSQAELNCNPVAAAQLYIDLATANHTYVAAIQTAMATLGSATTALATAQATHYEARQTYVYEIAAAKSTQVESYYNAGLTFLQAIFPSS